MIELTSDQAQAMESSGEATPRMVNPRTNETFVLVRQELYDRMQQWFAPLKRRWDNLEDDDLTRGFNDPRYSKKRQDPAAG